MSQYCFVLHSFPTALPSTTLHYKACTQHFPLLLRKLRPSTTLYYEACTKRFSFLLFATKLAHSTSQYYCVPQSFHTALPTTTLYCKACTKYVPVVLCTTKLAQSMFQYYFVLQSFTQHFPVLTCTTKLAQSTSQYYFVLQRLNKVPPSITLHKTLSICQHITMAAFRQPLPHDLRCPAAKDNSIKKDDAGEVGS